MYDGFVKLPRDFLNWRWFSDANVLKVYIYLLLNAAFKTTEWKNETLQKGQLITGRKKLAEAVNISESMVTRILKKLESTGDISLKSNNKYTVVTLLNWAKMQGNDYFFTDKRTTNEQQTANNRTQYKKEKNVNNVKNNSAPAREKKYNIYDGSIDWSTINEIINA